MKLVVLPSYLLYFQSLVHCNNLLNNWSNLSKQRIVKCYHDNYFNWNISIEKFVGKNLRKIQAVKTFKCGIGKVPDVDFTFKGKIKDFKLEGPGKLQMYEKSDDKYEK